MPTRVQGLGCTVSQRIALSSRNLPSISIAACQVSALLIVSLTCVETRIGRYLTHERGLSISLGT